MNRGAEIERRKMNYGHSEGGTRGESWEKDTHIAQGGQFRSMPYQTSRPNRKQKTKSALRARMGRDVRYTCKIFGDGERKRKDDERDQIGEKRRETKRDIKRKAPLIFD